VTSPSSGSQSSPALAAQDALTAMLLRRLTKSFGIPAADAEEIVRDALLWRLAAGAMSDPESWLVETVCTTARSYWRREAPGDATEAEMAAIRAAVFTGAALLALAPQRQEALRLRLHEGRTYREIAEAMDITPGYARGLVREALTKIARTRRK
jgi:DNA-directed RNA polymerase specialized sigma24 family protein